MAYATRHRARSSVEDQKPPTPPQPGFDDVRWPRYVPEDARLQADTIFKTSEGDGRSQPHRAHSYEAASRTQGYSVTSNKHPSELLREFVSSVRRKDFALAYAFLDKHPTIFDGYKVDTITGEAIEALQRGQRSVAENWIEKGLIIKDFRSLGPRERTSRIRRLRTDAQTIKDFEKEIGKAFEHCRKVQQASIPMKRSSPATAEEGPQNANRHLSTPGAAIARQESPPSTRHHEGRHAGPNGRQSHVQPLTNRSIPRPQSEVSRTDERHVVSRRDQPLGKRDEDSDRHADTLGRHHETAETSTLEIRWKVRSRSFYAVGRVFVMVEPVPPDFMMTDELSSYGPDLVKQSPIKVRRYVVVRVRTHYCTVIPVYTYGGTGLRKQLADVQSHAIIKVRGTPAKELPDEPRLLKRPIDVILSHQDRQLPEYGRLHFGKAQSYDFRDMKTLEVGMVSPSSMPYLVRYWHEEMQQTG